jgi:hypothetical protein
LSENQRKSPKFTTIIVIGDYTNMMKDIFGKALGINKPWFVADVNFDLAAKRLDINLDFVRGATFPFEQDGV